jgi:hypothetical protein
MSILSNPLPLPSPLHPTLLALEKSSLPPQLRLELEVTPGKFVPLADLTVAEAEDLCLVLYSPAAAGCPGIVCAREKFECKVRVGLRTELSPSEAGPGMSTGALLVEGDTEDEGSKPPRYE